MLNFFKSQKTTTVLGYIFLFILLKIPFILSLPSTDIAAVQNLWNKTGAILGNFTLINFLIAQICLFTQAIWFNYLFHDADYHQQSTMIPALYFALLTALLPQFNVLSVYTIYNFILLALFHTFLSITGKEKAKQECFNIGILTGVLLIINVHFLLLLPFVFIILYAIKPFRINDFLMATFGFLFPIYLALGISYVVAYPIDFNIFLRSNFYFLRLENNVLQLINLISASVMLLFSFVSLRGIMYSVGFKRRKNIAMLIFLYLGLTATILFSGNLDETALSLLILPIGVFLSLFMLRIRKKQIGEILNAIFVIVIFVTNVIRIFK